MKRKVLWWLVIAVVVVVVINYFARPAKVRVEVVAVDRGEVEHTVANTRAGTVEACLRSKLSLPIGGQIDRVLVDEGDRVDAGQPLVVLWNRDREAHLNQTKATLNSAMKNRESICISARSDKRESDRFRGLVKQNLVSQELADRAEAKAEASAFTCEAAKFQQLEAEAAIKVAEAYLEQTFLYAPFAGKVAEVTGEVGEYSTPSPPGVATPPAIDLLTDDCHYITAPIDEVDAAGVREGMPVRITLDAFKGINFTGVVKRIAPYVLDLEKQARTVDVEVSFDAASIENVVLLAGYSADVEIILERRENVVRAPTELLIEGGRVMVVNDEGVLEQKSVTAGISNWRKTEIVSGLQGGDEIVRSLGLPGVEPGRAVEVQRDAARSGEAESR